MSQTIGGRLNRLLGLDEIQPAGRAAFAEHCYRVSDERARLAMLVALIVNLVLCAVVDYGTWSAGHWELEPSHYEIFAWRLGVFTILLLLFALRHIGPSKAARDRTFSWAAAVAVPLLGVWFCIAFQGLANDVSIFAIFMLGTAVMLPLPNPAKLLIYPAALAPLLLGLNLSPMDSAGALHTSINAACVCIAALVIDAAVMRSCAAAFAQKEQIRLARLRSDAMLSNILPPSIIQRLQSNDESLVELHPSASVLFADFAGFSKLAETMSPGETIGLLEALFQEFDEAAARFGVEKIKTLGDSYMAACGVPEARGDHPERIAALALRIRSIAQRFRSDRGQPVHFRIGIASGPVIAGVIGRKRFCYDLWGETVNTACLLQASSALGGIHVSSATRKALGSTFSFAEREPIRIKGRAPIQTYYLVGRSVDRESVREALRIEQRREDKVAQIHDLAKHQRRDR